MTRLRQVYFRLGALLRKRNIEEGLTEELRIHVEMQVEANVSAGMSHDEARSAALRELGGVEQVKERYRDEFQFRWLEESLRDGRHAIRSLMHDPTFTATALLIFALCLAANVVIFSLVNTVLIRPLPFFEPQRLVAVYDSYPGAGLARGGVSPLHYIERTAAIRSFEQTAAWTPAVSTLGEGSMPQSVELMDVTPSFFDVLGVRAALGRTFTAEDIKDSGVVLSDELWRTRFNSDPTVLGRTIRIDKLPFVVIGVMPRGFRFLSQSSKLWTPLSFSEYDRRPDQRYRPGMEMIARLRRGATVSQAQAQIDALNAHPVEGDSLAALVHKMGFHTVVCDLHADNVAGVESTLLLLQAGVLSLLIIGVVNLANLVLVRATGRTKEFSLRQALGGSGFQLGRGQVIETLILASAGAGIGLGLGAAALRSVAVLAADRLPLGIEPGLDSTTLIITVASSVVLGTILSLPAVWQTRRRNLSIVLSQESRGATSTRAVHRLRHILIVAQITLSVILLAGTGLLALSFHRVLSVDPGFRSEKLLTAAVVLPWSTYSEPEKRVAFVQQLLAALRTLPGVQSAGISTRVPFAGSDSTDFDPILIEDRELGPEESAAVQYNRGISGDYLATLGVPLRAGRFFSEADSVQANKVCLIDETIAHRYWPAGDAIGHRLVFGNAAPKKDDYFTIVGIVGAVKQNSLADQHAYGAVYYPNALFPSLKFTVAMRTTLAPETFSAELRAAVLRIDPSLPLTDLKTMEARVSDSLAGRRISLLLSSIFAGVALVLAAVGIFGVLAYTVAQRRREIGIRLALGAAPNEILWQFIALGIRLLAIGIPLGLIGAWGVGKIMRELLYDVSPANPIVLAGTTVVIAAVALSACIIPSRRASQVAPTEALQ